MTQLPIGKSFTPEQLGELFVAVEDEPYGNPLLGYRIMIPQGWTADTLQAESAELNASQLKPLGVFFRDPNDGTHAYIQIQAIHLPKTISAANWLRHFSITTEKKIQVINEISPSFVDSLLSFEIEDTRFLGRTACRIDKNRLFLLLMFAVEEAYEPLAEFFGVGVASFKLLNQDPEATIEPYASLQGPANLKFNYPNSWQSLVNEDPPLGKEVVDLYNFDDEKNLNGLIRIKSVSKKISGNVDELVHSLLAEFQASNLMINGLRHQAEVPIQTTHFFNGQYAIYDAHIADSDSPQELWLTTFEDTSHYYGVVLLTPVKEHIFYVWAINQRTYQIILSSLH